MTPRAANPPRSPEGHPRGLTLFTGDWLDLARSLPPRSIDLLYVDPPFNTGVRKASPPAGARLKRSRADYPDSWKTMAEYIGWLRDRVAATVPALKPSANVLIHCDWRASHRIRVLLDELLGADRFVNHIIWAYGLGGSSPRAFARKHDDILFYCLDPRAYYFMAPRVPATSRRLAGRDKKATDVLSIPALNNMAAERTGYPTQKPLALLRMLVQACCPPAGAVLDPCCGSGTTLVAARELGRSFVGGDLNPCAVAIVEERLS